MSSNKTLVLTIFRALLRSCRALEICSKENPSGEVYLRRPLDLRNQTSTLFEKASEAHYGILKELFPGISKALLHDQPFIFKPGKLAKIIHKGFAENKDVSSKKDTLLDKAIDALRTLDEQKILTLGSSVTVTEGVKCSATSQYVTHSDEAGHFWAFRCYIENLRDKEIQIVGNEWTYFDKNGVDVCNRILGSPSIEGRDPILRPGGLLPVISLSLYSLNSRQILDHLQLETNGGRIEGSFQWIYPDFDRHNFTWQDAEVKSFKLLSSNLAGTPPIGTEQL